MRKVVLAGFAALALLAGSLHEAKADGTVFVTTLAVHDATAFSAGAIVNTVVNGVIAGSPLLVMVGICQVRWELYQERCGDPAPTAPGYNQLTGQTAMADGSFLHKGDPGYIGR